MGKRKRETHYVCTGFGDTWNYILEGTSLSSSFGIYYLFRKGPCTIYTACSVDLAYSASTLIAIGI